jgi:hypothetical protein
MVSCVGAMAAEYGTPPNILQQLVPRLEDCYTRESEERRKSVVVGDFTAWERRHVKMWLAYTTRDT